MRSLAALKFFLLLVATLISLSSLAAGVGRIGYVAGTLTVQRAGRTIQKLSEGGADVSVGDILSTQPGSLARIYFTDGSVVGMVSDTRIKIEAYQFVEDRPQEDQFVLRLLTGGIRTQSGLTSRRGNPDASVIATSAAVIYPHGSSAGTVDCTRGCKDVIAKKTIVKKGVFHTVYSGSYFMQNQGGARVVAEGEIGFAPDENTVPAIVADGSPMFGFQPFPSDTGQSPKESRTRIRIQGLYYRSFETSAISPCGKEAGWWLNHEMGSGANTINLYESAAYRRIENVMTNSCKAPNCEFGGEAYVDATVDVSPVGAYGHMGEYFRDAKLVTLHRVSDQPLGACR